MTTGSHNASETVTRADIEAKLAEIRGVTDSTTEVAEEAVKPALIILGVAIVLGAFLLGSASGSEAQHDRRSAAHLMPALESRLPHRRRRGRRGRPRLPPGLRRRASVGGSRHWPFDAGCGVAPAVGCTSLPARRACACCSGSSPPSPTSTG